MPNQQAVEAFLHERIATAVAPRTGFSIGSVKDEMYCLLEQDGLWVVGTGERGRFYPEALFKSDVHAAQHLILLLLQELNSSFTYPAVDWTGYASLPVE